MALDTQKIDALRIDPSQRVRRGSPWLRNGFLALLVLGLLAAGTWYFLSGERATAVELVAATAAPSGGASDATVLSATGYVVARRLATVSSKVTGKIEQVLIEEGMEVSEGDVLAVLDGATTRAQFELARSQLAAARTGFAETAVRREEAERELARSRTLVAQKLISAAQLDRDESQVKALDARLAAARSQVTVAERQVALAAQSIDDLTIRAPFKGVVITKNAQPGEMISPVSSGGFTRTGICTIVDMDSLEIEVDVNESYINRVSPGQPVSALLDAYPDWRLEARVINIVPTADRQKATVKVRIGFDRLDGRILPDMGVKVSFLEERVATSDDEARPPVLATIPASATTRSGDRTYVWQIEDGRAVRRAIGVGASSGQRVDVVSGLRPNERVLRDPTGIEQGQRVRAAGD